MVSAARVVLFVLTFFFNFTEANMMSNKKFFACLFVALSLFAAAPALASESPRLTIEIGGRAWATLCGRS